MVSFIYHYNAISIDRLPSKTKIRKKFMVTLIILFYEARVLLSCIDLFFLKKNKNKKTKNQYSASDWWEYTKSCFTENLKIFSKTSTTQENIAISRQNFLLY